MDAIKHMHDRGIAHRDFKAGNIMLVEKEDGFEIKIIDFGTSSFEVEDNMEKYHVTGSQNNIRPCYDEEALSLKQLQMNDAYGAGLMFLDMYYGIELLMNVGEKENLGLEVYKTEHSVVGFKEDRENVSKEDREKISWVLYFLYKSRVVKGYQRGNKKYDKIVSEMSHLECGNKYNPNPKTGITSVKEKVMKILHSEEKNKM
jgi:serine/threonine protein kinase